MQTVTAHTITVLLCSHSTSTGLLSNKYSGDPSPLLYITSKACITPRRPFPIYCHYAETRYPEPIWFANSAIWRHQDVKRKRKIPQMFNAILCIPGLYHRDLLLETCFNKILQVFHFQRSFSEPDIGNSWTPAISLDSHCTYIRCFCPFVRF